jgi:hypothetical protein
MSHYISPNGGESNAQQHVTEMFKQLGQKIAHIVRQDGQYLSPLLASFTARMITLEQTGRFPVEGPSAVASLPPQLEDELIQLTIERALVQNDPLYETVKMQITFESFYAMELQRLRNKALADEESNQSILDSIVHIGTNLVSSQQVAALYRMIFKLLLSNSSVDSALRDRVVEREVAVALESVFPQAGLNAFNLLSPADKRKQVTNLVNIVLGIRLFNKEIRHGGAGLPDVPALLVAETDMLYERLEAEAQEMGDISFTLTDLVNVEFQRPGTLLASTKRLQDELVNRRQYVLLIHQLQHEVVGSLDASKQHRVALEDQLTQLKSIVGIRTSVPKEQVYPMFHVIATAWRALVREREKTALRTALLVQLQQFRTSFTAARVEDDLPQLKHLVPEGQDALPQGIGLTASGAVDYDAFVETVVDSDAGSLSAAALGGVAAGADARPQRLVKETTLNFMSLPLEHQGYCGWSIVMRAGLLVSGDPALGIVRFRGRHYSFSSIAAMRDFCVDPEKFVDGVVLMARHQPALIHLLGLTPVIPNTDIADYFSLLDAAEGGVALGKAHKADAQTQIGAGEYISTDLRDPAYEWNEWALRKKAIQMANLCDMRTVSTQTDASHFRRDNATQTYVKSVLPDGTMPGVGTQTGIDKGTNVETVKKFHFGLRGQPNATFRTIEVVTPAQVTDASNGDLRKMADKIVTRPIIREANA